MSQIPGLKQNHSGISKGSPLSVCNIIILHCPGIQGITGRFIAVSPVYSVSGQSKLKRKRQKDACCYCGPFSCVASHTVSTTSCLSTSLTLLVFRRSLGITGFLFYYLNQYTILFPVVNGKKMKLLCLFLQRLVPGVVVRIAVRSKKGLSFEQTMYIIKKS